MGVYEASEGKCSTEVGMECDQQVVSEAYASHGLLGAFLLLLLSVYLHSMLPLHGQLHRQILQLGCKVLKIWEFTGESL